MTINVEVPTASYRVFLALTGHAFDSNQERHDSDKTHGYYWAMRWLAREILGETWFTRLNCGGIWRSYE